MERIGLKILFFLGLVITVSSCLKNPFDDEDPVVIKFPAGQSAFVLNEGSFGQGTASIDHINLFTGEYTADVFQQANNRPLGDILQDMDIVGDRAYLVLNNSNKIEVVEMDSFRSVGTITGLTSPRFIQFVAFDKAYVTDLFANEIAIINPQTFEKTGSIPLKGWTEEMTFQGNRLYVTNRNSDKVYIVDINNDVVSDSIQFTYGTAAIEQDNVGRIWVYCTGDEQQGIDAGLFSFDPVTKTVLDTFPFPANTAFTPKMAYNPIGNALYIVQDGVRALSAVTLEFAPEPLVPAEGFTLYGLDIDPRIGNVFALDAKDFQQRGEVNIYLPTGEEIGNFPTGVNPNGVIFY